MIQTSELSILRFSSSTRQRHSRAYMHTHPVTFGEVAAPFQKYSETGLQRAEKTTEK
jgi:hypothetical protein